ncbi:hypothetical protein DL93DRAFT_2071048 [Clavulina sp. PMI_390]|nr:hypothetical protein DL93DRAFT_2071048 [Clavulina sp. PMI_390]
MALAADKPRLAILDDYQDLAFKCADWSAVSSLVDITVFKDTIQQATDEEALVERLRPFEIICSMRERTKFPASVLGKLPNLKLLTTTGLRNAAIDMEAARREGIIVAGTGYTGDGTAEHNWTLIMAVARGLVFEHNNTVNGNPQWQNRLSTELGGKTLGLVGLGKLGKATLKFARVFGMEVCAWSPNLTPERAAEAGVKFVSKEELFRTSDVVSVHMVLAPSTKDLIGSTEFGWMKPTAFIVNTSRGPIVNEAALLDALNNEKIAGAGIDVFDIEPLPLDHPIRKAKNITLSPHIGYVGDRLYKVSIFQVFRLCSDPEFLGKRMR